MTWTQIINTILWSYALIGATLWKLKVDESGVLWHTRRFHIGWLIAWYDCWVGVYRKPNGCFYIMIPFMGITFTWYKRMWKYRPELDQSGRMESKYGGMQSIAKNAVIQSLEADRLKEEWIKQGSPTLGGAVPIPDEHWTKTVDESGATIWTLSPDAQKIWQAWAHEVRMASGVQMQNGKLVSMPLPPFPEFPPKQATNIK